MNYAVIKETGCCRAFIIFMASHLAYPTMLQKVIPLFSYLICNRCIPEQEGDICRIVDTVQQTQVAVLVSSLMSSYAILSLGPLYTNKIFGIPCRFLLDIMGTDVQACLCHAPD
jgi:hypothetical protein